MIDKNRLEAKCAALGIALTGPMLDALDQYAEILVEYNQKVNLTAITDPEGIEDKHFADSLLLANLPETAGKLVDVGTGAGFPGVVAKIFKPELQLTLMEPTGKRVEFLKYVCAQLGLSGVEFAKERAEEAARKVWREQFDVATARGVAALPMLSEYCLPLVKVGGVFLAMKGPGAAEELAESGAALKKLGGKGSGVAEFHLPGGDVRNIIRIKKISQTPPVYPRNGGKIAKSPLK
ncbi:MAG: 16S rRNA (guanine(527)-N(7))-methyltransferase RsmG [Subdoligranulum sp.]|nr:16S rRNA (guanine(527)-N(7))-methyltransferase RsmG [Subdoligranulum sp.]MCI7541685.1 16S rRNA (guanine(527)-N(7))-methyltransferase RsmG [Subdoligranulum sp.]MDD7264631.1 16S rRNA (guanine(527)-N(7))-methyltransferase RsmG [Subdoligranulum sp.]MDY5922508.1 16S rRNA (guanine(527)-N(7))-methyltransferase RsmG [Oscillospiraceae bacterium]